MKTLSILIAIVTLSSACTWVKVNESGTSVAVANMANVRNCEKLRNVNVKVKASVGPIDRNADKVATELAKDRKSTRLNSSHVKISYAVFCLKKKKKKKE